MREIVQGIWHWTTPRESIGGTPVSSYWLEQSGVLIDPMVPPAEGIEWFAGRTREPQAIVLCNRHHYRDSDRFHDRYGVEVHVPAAGMHAFTAAQPVVAYEPGETLPGGLVAVEVGSLSPDDGGMYLEAARSLWLADTLVRAPTDPESPLGWVTDGLMDDPPATKRGLLAAFERILAQLDFENLMLAHGLPLIGNGRTELEELVSEGGRTSEDAF